MMKPCANFKKKEDPLESYRHPSDYFGQYFNLQTAMVKSLTGFQYLEKRRGVWRY